MQEKIKEAVERLILSGALAKQRVYNLSIAEQECAQRDNRDNNRIV